MGKESASAVGEDRIPSFSPRKPTPIERCNHVSAVKRTRSFGGAAFIVFSSLFLVFALAGATSAGASVQDPAPSANSGTTIDPLQSNCGNDAPTCGQVGESYGFYNGTNVDLLYSENYFLRQRGDVGCDHRL